MVHIASLDLMSPHIACRQHATGKRGLYRTLLVEQRPMSLAKDFRPQALEDESLPPARETPEEVERRFWRNVNLRPPLYGADVPGSLFDEDLKVQCYHAELLTLLLGQRLDVRDLRVLKAACIDECTVWEAMAGWTLSGTGRAGVESAAPGQHAQQDAR